MWFEQGGCGTQEKLPVFFPIVCYVRRDDGPGPGSSRRIPVPDVRQDVMHGFPGGKTNAPVYEFAGDDRGDSGPRIFGRRPGQGFFEDQFGERYPPFRENVQCFF